MEERGVNPLEAEGVAPDFREKHDRLRRETLANIRKLQRKFTIELLAAALFLLLSIAALSDFAFFPSFPEDVRAALGSPPSVNMISAGLLLYFNFLAEIKIRVSTVRYAGSKNIVIPASLVIPAPCRSTG